MSTFSITPTDAIIPEAIGIYPFEISWIGAPQGVYYFKVVTLSDANASGFVDYGNYGPYTLSPDSSFVMYVEIVNDNLIEGNQTFALVVLDSATSDPGTDYLARAIFTIWDDDGFSKIDDFADGIHDPVLPVSPIGFIDVNQSLSGKIETPGDLDFFKVHLIDNQTYSFGLDGSPTATGALHDPYLYLYDQYGTLLGYDDDNGSGSNSLLNYTSTKTADYYIAASAYNNLGTGSYQVRVTGDAGFSATDDYLGTGASPARISVGQTVNGNIETAGDKDWIGIVMQAGVTYSIALNAAASRNGTLYDPLVKLYDPHGVFLASNDDDGVGNNSLLQYTVAPGQGGTYFIEASSAAATGTGTYQIAVTSSAGGSGTDDFSDSLTDISSPKGSIAGQPVSGNIESAGDKDWFSVDLMAGSTYSIALKGQSTTDGTLYDPFVSLYSMTGVLLATNDDGGTLHNSLLQYTVPTGGYAVGTRIPVFIEARSADGAGTGTYQLTLSSPSTSSTADDFADSLTDTPMGAITVGQTRSGNVETGGDKDWFAVTLTAGTSYSIKLDGVVTGSGTLYDPFVSLYNSAGAFLASNDDDGVGANSLLQYTAPGTPGTTSTYYVEARAFSSTATGTYQVGLISGAGGGTGPSPGDDYAGSSATTGVVAAGQVVTGNVETAGDKDWFSIVMQAGVNYSIALNAAASRAGTLYDPFVSLYSNGVLLASDDDSGVGNNSLLQFTPATSGTYYIEAGAAAASATGTYEIGVTSTATTTTDDITNDINTWPTLEPEGASHSGTIEIGGDRDWFMVGMFAGLSYVISLGGVASGSGTLHDPFVSLYNSTGQLVASDDDSGVGSDSLLRFTAPASSNIYDAYYVVVRGFGITDTGTYRVRVGYEGGGGGGAGDDYAGSSATTGVVSAGQVVTGNVETAGDKDWFAITMTEGTTYSIALNAHATGSGTLYDPFVALYSSFGTLLASDDDSGTGNNSLLQYTAMADGTYYIEAHSAGVTGTGTYQVAVSAAGGGSSAADDWADSFTDTAAKGAIAPGQIASGNLESGGDKDWFAITLQENTTYSFGLNGQATASGTLYDPNMSLYNSAGTRVGSDDDSGVGNNSLLQYTTAAGAGGTYYIEAGTFNASATGTYQVVVSAAGGGSSAADDWADSFADTAARGAIVLGQFAGGNVESAGDKDWFAVTLAAGSSYSIALKGQITGDGTLYDPFVSLYNSAGVLLASDDDSGAGHNSLLQYAATTSDTYYVEARAFSSTATGTYHVEVDLVGVTGP